MKIKSIWEEYETLVRGDIKLTIIGRIYTCRKNSDSLLFIHITDGSTIKLLQCVCNKENIVTGWEKLYNFSNRGATVQFKGILVNSPAKGQPIELLVDEAKILGKIIDPSDYPLGTRGYIMKETMRSIPHMRYHSLPFLAINIIKNNAYKSIHETMSILNINEIQPTLITGNECEGGSDAFCIEQIDDHFFKKPVYLTVSSQLHLEATVVGTLRDTYCITTACRKEESKGPLHLAEFSMLEWEIVEDNIERNMYIAEHIIKNIISNIIDNCIDELELLSEYVKKDSFSTYQQKVKILKNGSDKKMYKQGKKILTGEYKEFTNRPHIIDRLKRYITKPFVRVTFNECIEKMLEAVEKGHKFNTIPSYENDISKEHERYITDVMCDGLPVFVTEYPWHIKAFYMKKKKGEYADCYDLLFPYIGEVVGGSQRINDYDELNQIITDMKLSGLEWYLDTRKYGSVPHGGGGLGIGRLLMAITGINNIKDIQDFPRAFDMLCFA